MSGCLRCATITEPSGLDGIGVCVECGSIACPSHGGKDGNQPRFVCGDCVPGMATRSAGRRPPGSPPRPGSSPPEPPPAPPGGGSTGPSFGGGPAGQFAGSPDFEARMPFLAEASRRYRYSIHADGVRGALSLLFGLLSNTNDEIDRFYTRAADQLALSVAELISTQVSLRDSMRQVYEERGGQAEVARQYLDEVIAELRAWLTSDLAGWLAEINPDLSESRWLNDGLIDIALLADAIGLIMYTWDLPIGASPFSRLDMARQMPTGLLVLTETYTQAVPVLEGVR
jgi:hypothetical protein